MFFIECEVVLFQVNVFRYDVLLFPLSQHELFPEICLCRVWTFLWHTDRLNFDVGFPKRELFFAFSYPIYKTALKNKSNLVEARLLQSKQWRHNGNENLQ